MDHSLSLPAPAKINLFLHITGRRENGYHELQTVFQILDVGDELHFTLTDDDSLSILPPIQGVLEQDNLIYKAAELLKPYRAAPKGIHIELTKRLPMGGGLGGGSSDAATTLLALNHLWQCHLPLEKLTELGLQLGADVPVFVQGKTAWAEGVGEQLTSIETPESWYLILEPNAHISTAQIFSNEVLTRDTPKIKIAPALEGQALDTLRNDCEPVVTMLYPNVKEAISWLQQFGPARLTGTGACCFCRFESESKARQVLNEARSKFKGFIAKGVHLSPAHQRLDEAKAFAKNSQH
jgi:4-diphosphocytidyl-2-C-methyl-D-erythritol kinase